jgi:hypothetical protein
VTALLQAIVYYLGLAALLLGVTITWRLRRHVDKERLQKTEDLSKAFSLFGPSYEVLSDKGRKLLAASYVLIFGGILLPMVVASLRIVLR